MLTLDASVNARYIRISIDNWIGLQPRVYCVIPYSKGEYSALSPPTTGQYVLVIGDQLDGFTFTQLAQFIRHEGYQVFSIPHYKASSKALKSFTNQPAAIVVSGNNTDFSLVPAKEYLGVWDIIRNTNIPLLGICAGHEFLAMSYDYTYVRFMGWHDFSVYDRETGITEPNVLVVPMCGFYYRCIFF